MSTTTVFVVSNHLMFGQGLEKLLDDEREFEVIGRADHIQEAVEQIFQLQPQLVIVDNDVDNDGPLSCSAVHMLDILKTSPSTKVVSLNLHSNRFYVYRAAQSVVKRVEDFVAAVKPSLEAT